MLNSLYCYMERQADRRPSANIYISSYSLLCSNSYNTSLRSVAITMTPRNPRVQWL